MCPDSKSLIFRQLFDKTSSTYTYLLADKETLEGLIIDTVIEQHERDLRIINELGIKLLYTLETHIHADHVTGASQLKNSTQCKIMVSIEARVKNADQTFKEGDLIKFGRHSLKVISTPGHTGACTSFYLVDSIFGMVFTGDTLLIRACGRTDFQQGSPENMYDNINKKLFTLPNETLIFPAHNYMGMTVSTIAEEKKYNPRLKTSNSKEQFVEIMKNLKLDYPAQIDVALPANMNCGKSTN
ncbi:MAG: MBL fold metallo-hydrolase [Pseudomonadota bacterium]|nr:MBL fold metallo-hydrolase [Pseudomonadota bacterium]